ncbi:hypothetical protein EV363DRAFT_285537 [Boletus edulis]|uniref:Secreted protein n=1 Tax=Boletus edulis BED1 TaxID=1328754 RepID=A0AAD4C9S9_BOLED|nr:hypothetical protein EV363DRAFT_285537 [Boletus edulis]KAF8452907.1 hypothetical protein L210DRAFT_3519952 [Boletus edulis BED1]
MEGKAMMVFLTHLCGLWPCTTIVVLLEALNSDILRCPRARSNSAFILRYTPLTCQHLSFVLLSEKTRSQPYPRDMKIDSSILRT